MIYNLQRILAAVAALSVVASSVSSTLAATLHTDDFQTGTTTLGWTGGSSPQRIAAGGPGGAGDAFLRIVPNDFRQHLAVHNSTTAWVGDYGALGAAEVRVHMMNPAASVPLSIRLVLHSPRSTLTDIDNRWTSTVAAAVPNDGQWRSYAFAIAESALTRVQGAGTYQHMLANVERVMLRHDAGPPSSGGSPVSGAGVALNLDNIELAAAPQPLIGDFNGDGTVNGVDLEAETTGWKARFGVDLDGEDFLHWQRNFGQTAAAASVTGVPEPTAAALSLAAWAVMFARARRAGSRHGAAHRLQ